MHRRTTLFKASRFKKSPPERVKENFEQRLAIAWRKAELAGCQSPKEDEWLAIKQEILEESNGYMGWSYMLLQDQDKVREIFAEVCAELQL